MGRPLLRTSAFVLLAALAGAPGIGIACGLACELLDHHRGSAHAHHTSGSDPASAHAHHAGHHGHEPARPTVASHHACQHAPQEIQAVVQRVEADGVDGGREISSTTAAAGAPAAPRTAGRWIARPRPQPPPASSSLRATVLRL